MYTLSAMINITDSEQMKPKKFYSQLTLLYPRIRLIFKDGAVDLIKKSKGYKTDSDLARALGISRAYMSFLRSGQRACNDEVICRVAYLMNNFDKWYIYFQIVNCGEPIPENHQINNMKKYYGIKPYEHFSTAAAFRKQDNTVEEKNT